MRYSFHPRSLRLAVRWLVWCLALAVPSFGVSGTIVELLGSSHVHVRSSSAMDHSDPMSGWVDMRRAPPIAMVAKHIHSHDSFARHHHDRDDASVVSLDGASDHGDSSGDGTGSASLSHVLALVNLMPFDVPSPARFDWSETVSSAVAPWCADRPLRPPKG